MVALTDDQADALVAVRRAWPDAEVVLIGALALGHHIPMDYRHTNDLDLAVAIGVDHLAGALSSLDGWRRHPSKPHSFLSPRGQMVDVLPAGTTLIEQGYVDWPTGERMSLVGFDLAFTHGAPVSVGGTTVQVPSAPVLALLKMRAWLDRPAARQKDLGDLAHLLCRYIGDDDDRRFEDELLELPMAFDAVSPFVLGRDLGHLVLAHHTPHIIEFLAKASPEQLAAEGPPGWRTAEDAERALTAFRSGLQHGGA